MPTANNNIEKNPRGTARTANGLAIRKTAIDGSNKKKCFSDKHLLKGSCCGPISFTFLLMRFHIFHEASSYHLLISDSQTHSVPNNTTIAFGVVNVLTLPGGQIRHLYDFLPKPAQYKSVTLFIGGNDSYLRGGNIFSTPAQEIANELKTLADFLSDNTEEVYLIGIPERFKSRNAPNQSMIFSLA